jgi:hypothetical protein
MSGGFVMGFDAVVVPGESPKRRITNEQREAIVREAVAKRDAFLAGQVDPSSLEQRLREWVDSLPAGTLGQVHIATLMSVARAYGVMGLDGGQQ